MQFLTSFTRNYSNTLNSKVMPYTITFSYVSFADQFSGLNNVLEVDYDS